MGVELRFVCDKCGEDAKGTDNLRKAPDSYFCDNPQWLSPCGWKAYERNTGQTFCPRCWEKFEKELAA